MMTAYAPKSKCFLARVRKSAVGVIVLRFAAGGIDYIAQALRLEFEAVAAAG